MELSADERALCDSLGFQLFVADLLKTETQAELRQLMGFDLEQDKVVSVIGLSATFEPGQALSEKETLVDFLNEDINLLGYKAFYSDSYEIGNVRSSDEIAIIKTEDSFDFVRVKATCAPNFDISPDAILEKLQNWKSRFGLTVTGAASDWVAFKFHSIPKEICQFAEEVYDFCPDSVEQGVGLMKEEEDPEFFSEARALCDGISQTMKQKLLVDFEPMDDEEFSEDEKAAIVDETETGILLLANYIKTFHCLFLWWD